MKDKSLFLVGLIAFFIGIIFFFYGNYLFIIDTVNVKLEPETTGFVAYTSLFTGIILSFIGLILLIWIKFLKAEIRSKKSLLISGITLIIFIILICFFTITSLTIQIIINGHYGPYVIFGGNDVDNTIIVIDLDGKVDYDEIEIYSVDEQGDLIAYYVQNNMSIGIEKITQKTGNISPGDVITGFKDGIRYNIVYTSTDTLFFEYSFEE